MMPLRSDKWPESVSAKDVSPEAFRFLNYLRFLSMRCRARPRADLFQACALLHATKSQSREAHAEALMRCLGEAFGKPARLLAPGVSEVTFDEAWLVQLGLASAREDEASVIFMLRSRVIPEHQRLISFLIHRTSRHFF
jgi:hypothetical protein